MIKYCVQKWNKNKDKLEAAIRKDVELNGCNYSYLVELIVKYILNDEENGYIDTWNHKRITVIDDGDYQGTEIFLIPSGSYQPGPDNYLMTYVYYGSCSGCDTLMSIQDYYEDDKVPTESQVKDYMTLCLHLIQNMIKPYKGIWSDEDEEYEEFREKEENKELEF